MFRQNFSCSALLEDLIQIYLYGAITHYWPAFPDSSSFLNKATGLIRVRSPLLTESLLMSFPLAT